MTKRMIKFIPALLLAILPCLTTGSIAPAAAAEIADYTAFPPFLPRVVSPNILFLLDFSKSMIRPAHGECNSSYQNCRFKFFNANDDYDASLNYAGFYIPGRRYSCESGLGMNDTCTINSAGDYTGNWLNWLSATQFDVLKKVAVGGRFAAAPENGNPGTLSSDLTNETLPNLPADEKANLVPAQSTPTYREFYKVVEKQACLDNAPDAECDTTTPQQVPYRWIDTPASGATYLWKNESVFDVNSKNIALPFTVPYFGQDYTRANISDNGFIQLKNDTTDTPTYFTNYNIPYNDSVNNLIAIWWDDLVMRPLNFAENAANESYVAYFTRGTAPNRVLVITWNNIYPYAATTIDKAVSFQMLIFEGDGQIVFQYKDVDGGLGSFSDNNSDKAKSATIGLEDSTGTLGKKYYFGGWTDLNSNGINDPDETPLAGIVKNNLALHMNYGYKIFRINPGGGAVGTSFRPAGVGDASPFTHHVRIDVLKGANAVDNSCPDDDYYVNKASGNCYDHKTEGLIQEFRDGELAGLLGFRLAIMQFNSSADGGNVVKHFNDTANWTNTIVALRNQIPLNEAPLAETLHMAQGYFRQVDTDYELGNTTNATSWINDGTGATCASTGSNNDPYCFKSAAQKVPCAKSYVLLVSSGNYSHDFSQNTYGDAPLAVDKTPFGSAVRLTSGEIAGTQGTLSNGGWLDNVAYKMRTTDLRGDIDGEQTVSLYAVNTFGGDSNTGSAVLKRAALFGGFKDANGNNAYDSEDTNGNCILDPGEDVNGNGVIDGEDDCDDPKTYLQANSGEEGEENEDNLKSKIVSAVTDILKNSASGTSVSVLSTSAGGEGALYQAYFYPARIENLKEDRKWPGFLRAFLLDTYQQLRDDYSGNGSPDHTLNTANDRVAKMYLDENSSEVMVKLYQATGKLADNATTAIPDVRMDDVVSMWEGGSQLAKSNKSERRLYLWHDANKDGVIDNGDFSAIGGETMLLEDTNAAALAPFLRAGGIDAAAKTAEAENIINFIRGTEISGYRSRCITVAGASTELGCQSSGQRVWPLGDIIFSTPTLVGAPAEKYNQIYGDQSYFAFYNAYKNRRQVVYLGANDGMLHAFNAGVFNPTTISFADNPAGAANGWTAPAPGLGDEIWAFLPHDNLPHLAWLACNGTATDPATCGDSEYTHVYYVDHRPRVSDVRIFNYTDSDGIGENTSFSGGIDGQSGVAHPNGWGSILILPLRLGGGAINVDLNGDGDTTDPGETSFRSAYYAFDITDAEKPPKLLWRFSDPGLGFTTSYPAIVRIDDNGTTAGGNVKWFMVVGSGPQNDINTRDYGMSEPLPPSTTPPTTLPGKVFVVDLATGVKAHENPFVPSNLVTKGTIMGDPIAVDVNFDFSTDVLYIGSVINATAGRVFRINTKQNINPANWDYSTLFDPNPTQFNSNPDFPINDPISDKYEMGPLLVSPSVSMDRLGNLWVYFGSGRLKNINDLTNSNQQLFYGIKDKCWQSVAAGACSADGRVIGNNYSYTMGDLFDSSAVRVNTSTDSLTQVEQRSTDACAGSTTPGTCDFQRMVTNVQQKKGWYVTLDNPVGASERVLARSSVIGGLVLFTSYQPAGDICSIFGNSNLYAVYYETGTASNAPVVEGAAGVFTDGGTTYISPKIDLGAGMPTSVGIAIGETVSGFVQKSTGEIIRIEATPALNVRSSISSWRETTGNTGNAGVETIYEHIVK